MTPEEAAKRYHWVRYISETNTVELYLDNYMLSAARQCEAKFYLEHLLWVKPRYDTTRRKPWFLDFGEYIHWCVELFYNSYKEHGEPPLVDKWIIECKTHWNYMKMDDYGKLEDSQSSDYKKYVEVKGWEGVSGLLIQYYAFYMDLRNRIIDTEITFGHNKEVYLGEFFLDNMYLHKLDSVYSVEGEYKIVKCYLTGRIDLLVDNGYKIGPVDHKTTHKFDGWEHLDFNPHDGMTGYILAINEIMKKYKDMGLTKLPSCTGGWIYHISACTPSTPRDKTKRPEPRFKTTPIDKTEIALSDYKQRQLSTFKRIAEMLFNDKTPEWNTTICNNIFFRPCEYKQIHEQPSNEWEGMIKQFYQISTPWDTREHGQKKETTDSK
jgi:hypothetical protein